jgi:hypothetical protein
MKKNYSYTIVAALAVVLIASCSKINDGKIGFLSSQIRYLEDTLFIERGVVAPSLPIDIDGSTAPVTFELLDIRNNKGISVKADFLEKKYPITVFKKDALFNVLTDTTLELLNAKREIKDVPSMQFLEKSGVIVMNQASENLPLGRYVMDIKVKNSSGEKTFTNFKYFYLIDPDVSRIYRNAGGETVSSQSPPNGTDFIGLPNATVTLQQQSQSGTTIILKYTDKNGVPFNPKKGEIENRGDRPDFRSYARYNPVVFTDTAMILKYELSPFPAAVFIDPATGTNWSRNIYYRVINEFCQMDGYAPKQRHILPRLNFTINGRGTYLLTVKLNNVTHL